MTRITGLLSALILLVLPLMAEAQSASAKQLARALTQMREGDWSAALSTARRGGEESRDILTWHWLRAGKGSASDVVAFLERRPDWPGLTLLRRKGEPAMGQAGRRTILAFYDAEPPQTAEGVLDYASSLFKAGRNGEAEAALVLAWRTMAMPGQTQDKFLDRYGKLLKPHNTARLDRLLWDGHMVSSRRMLPHVSEAQKLLAEARISLQERQNGVDGRIAAVPGSVKAAPGLAYDRFVWRHRKDRDSDAISLLLERSTSAEALGEPLKWAKRRARLARQEMRSGDPARAYRIAARHHIAPTTTYAYADLEWLAGFIALRKLNDPATAAKHFERFDAAVSSPISKGRSGYWLGRAKAALGDVDGAHTAYAMGAAYQTSFYGLLAAEQIGRPFDPELASPTAPPDWRNAPFMSSSVLKAGLLLREAGEDVLAERFLTHLVEGLDTTQAQQLGQMAVDMKDPHLAVMIAKRAARQGMVLPAAYYPMHPVSVLDLPMAPEMNLSIARRESEFDPGVVSGAGARGLMQVMPATGKQVASKLGMLDEHSTGRMLYDWVYNAKLGAWYLSKMAGTFDGNVILMSAGYNAGPHRPLRWMDSYGDPRSAKVDMIDWIEMIPFSETRNYVMRVAESLPVYRARLGGNALPVPFSSELSGATLKAFAPKGE